jgi:hypothetical protein
MNELGFDLAWRFRADPTPEYGSWEVLKRQNINVKNETTGVTSTIYLTTTVETEKCGLNFNYSNKEELVFKSIDTCYCFKNKSELAIGGTFLSSFYQTLTFKIHACINSTTSNITCKSAEE